MSKTPRLLAKLSIADARTLYGVTSRALHLYEKYGLLRATRGQRNERYFDSEACRRLGWIARLRAVDVPLADIREVLDAEPGSESEIAIARVALEARRARVFAQLMAAEAEQLHLGQGEGRPLAQSTSPG
jgi:DNA-binding transcriptional MerR regulator